MGNRLHIVFHMAGVYHNLHQLVVKYLDTFCNRIRWFEKCIVARYDITHANFRNSEEVRLPASSARHNSSDESNMYAHVSFKLRTKIWAGEYVDIASLLPESPKDEPRYALAVRSGEHGSEPLVCVAAKSLGR